MERSCTVIRLHSQALAGVRPARYSSAASVEAMGWRALQCNDKVFGAEPWAASSSTSSLVRRFFLCPEEPRLNV